MNSYGREIQDKALEADVNKKLVWAMRDSNAENICLECAKKQNKLIITASYDQSQWTMADTGLCVYCGSTEDVFCEAIIKVQQESGLDPKDFFGNFPRILGGSEALKHRGIGANKPLNGYVLIDAKSDKTYQKPPHKRWPLYAIAGLIAIFAIDGTTKAEYYRSKTIEGLQQIEPARDKANSAMLDEYNKIQKAGVLLPIDKTLKKEHLESLLQNEKLALDNAKSTLEPLNYYMYPENAIPALNDASAITADKMRMLYVILQYKIANQNSSKESKEK